MPELVITRVFRPAELEPPARDTARAWARHHLVPDDWHESVFEDFENVCAIVGVEIATRPVRLYGGGTRAAPRILFPASPVRATARVSKASIGTRAGRAPPFAPMRLSTLNFTASSTRSPPSSAATCISCKAPSGRRVATVTNIR
jgi:hypothetical protein